MPSYGFRPMTLDSNKLRRKIGEMRNEAFNRRYHCADNMEWSDLNGQVKAFDRVHELFADDQMEDLKPSK